MLHVPEVVDHIGHTEEGQDKGTGPAVTLPDEVAARSSGLAQTLLCNGSVKLAMVPPEREQTIRKQLQVGETQIMNTNSMEMYRCEMENKTCQVKKPCYVRCS